VELPFSLLGRRDRVEVSLAVNEEPSSVGCGRLLSGEDIDLARGYLVCPAPVEFTGEIPMRRVPGE
jgi:hypothetical protein